MRAVRLGTYLHRVEGGLATVALLAMAVLPLAEAALRATLGIGIPGSFPFVQHLTLWVTFLGAALAAREGKFGRADRGYRGRDFHGNQPELVNRRPPV